MGTYAHEYLRQKQSEECYIGGYESLHNWHVVELFTEMMHWEIRYNCEIRKEKQQCSNDSV